MPSLSEFRQRVELGHRKAQTPAEEDIELLERVGCYLSVSVGVR